MASVAVTKAPMIMSVTRMPTMTKSMGMRVSSVETGSGSSDVDVPTVLPPTKTGELSPRSLADFTEMM
jgi:hypothetical protein